MRHIIFAFLMGILFFSASCKKDCPSPYMPDSSDRIEGVYSVRMITGTQYAPLPLTELVTDEGTVTFLPNGIGTIMSQDYPDTNPIYWKLKSDIDSLEVVVLLSNGSPYRRNFEIVFEQGNFVQWIEHINDPTAPMHKYERWDMTKQ